MNITIDMITEAVNNYFQDKHCAIIESDYNVILNDILAKITEQITPEIRRQIKLKKINMFLQKGVFGKLIDYKVYDSIFKRCYNSNVDNSSILISPNSEDYKTIFYDFTQIINEFFEEDTQIRFICASLLNINNDEENKVEKMNCFSIGTNVNSYMFGINYKPEHVYENDICYSTIILLNFDSYKKLVEKKLNENANEDVNKNENENENVDENDDENDDESVNENDENVNENADKYGRTPLHYAINFDNYENVKLLLDNGADVNAKDNEGKTPLYWAVEMGKYEIVKLLLEHGADVDIKDNDGHTPLHFAIDNYKCEIANFLLDYVADVNARNTPLQRAIKN